MDKGEIRALTGLRGVAACFVMAYHYFQSYYAYALPNGNLSKTFMLHGYIGVDLFFVLSGFVMSLNYGESFRHDFSSRAYFSFLYKRLARIYPLYIVVTIVATCIAFAGGINYAPLNPSTILTNAFLVQAWGFRHSLAGVSWSISTEFAAYVLFPLLVAVLLGNARWLTLAGTCIAILTLIVVVTRSPLQLNEVVGNVSIRTGPLDVFAGGTVYPLLRCLAGFALGLTAFYLAQQPGVLRWSEKWFAGDVVFALVITLLTLPGSDVPLVLLFVPLVIALSTGPSFTSKAMCKPAVYWLGIVSYSIYLLHSLVDESLRKPVIAVLAALHLGHASAIAGLCTVALVIAFSAVAYYGLEKPARDWARKMASPRIPSIKNRTRRTLVPSLLRNRSARVLNDVVRKAISRRDQSE